MPQNFTDVDVFTDPIVGPADSDPADATYVRTIGQGLANRTRNLKNDLVEVRNRFFGSWTERLGIFDGRAEISSTATPAPFTDSDDLDFAQSEADAAEYLWDITKILPRRGANAALILAVRVLVDPGVARSGANRISVILNRTSYGAILSPALTREQIGTQVFDNETENLQFIELNLGGTPHSINAAWTYKVVVACGNNSATNKDKIYAVEVDLSEAAV